MRRRMVFSLESAAPQQSHLLADVFLGERQHIFSAPPCPPDRVIEITPMGPRGVAAVVEQHPLAQLGEPGVGGLTRAGDGQKVLREILGAHTATVSTQVLSRLRFYRLELQI